jgi:hypothetical protein
MDMPNMPKKDITDPMRGPAVIADPMGDARAKAARMKKINPKGRKLDKNGNPIVTKEELEKSGMSLRDFLNKERGLTPRKDAPAKAARYTPLKQKALQPSSVGMKDDARRDERGDFPGEGAAKSLIAEGGAGAAAAQETTPLAMQDRAASEASKYTTGMMGGGKVKGYAPGGSVGRGYGKARGAKACKIC